MDNEFHLRRMKSQEGVQRVPRIYYRLSNRELYEKKSGDFRCWFETPRGDCKEDRFGPTKA